jgi:methylated-DNA-[protein]-cysteine S-methyltransferase
MEYFYSKMSSPIGVLKLVVSGRGLAAILWENDAPERVPLENLTEDNVNPLILTVKTQLEEYFAKKRTQFSIPLDCKGTVFQQQVWDALLTIPYGQTRSYRDIAVQINNPKAVRAVGAANGKNPISIIAPCHRVIGANGTLTGFAGGLDLKSYLLQLEAA